MTAAINDDNFFAAIRSGHIPPPECAKTLGLEITGFDIDRRIVELTYEGRPEFANPIGNVQGGFLSAMLDDTMGLAVTMSLTTREFAPTLNINVHFHRPAKIGQIQAIGRVVSRGKEVCQLSGELLQNDKIVATATATAIIRKM